MRALLVIQINFHIVADERIKIMNEIITGMRVIKMYCWEIPFSDLVAQVRRLECVKILRRCLAEVLWFRANEYMHLTLFWPFSLLWQLTVASNHLKFTINARSVSLHQLNTNVAYKTQVSNGTFYLVSFKVCLLLTFIPIVFLRYNKSGRSLDQTLQVQSSTFCLPPG